MNGITRIGGPDVKTTGGGGKERRPPGSAGRLLLTLDETAELLAVSRRSVYTLIANGDLEDVYPMPGAHRVKQSSVIAFLARRTAAR
jgi:excisionase family DNA binding protein